MLSFSSALIARTSFGLRQLAAEPAQVPLEVPQQPKLLAERHCNL